MEGGEGGNRKERGIIGKKRENEGKKGNGLRVRRIGSTEGAWK